MLRWYRIIPASLSEESPKIILVALAVPPNKLIPESPLFSTIKSSPEMLGVIVPADEVWICNVPSGPVVPMPTLPPVVTRRVPELTFNPLEMSTLPEKEVDPVPEKVLVP